MEIQVFPSLVPSFSPYTSILPRANLSCLFPPFFPLVLPSHVALHSSTFLLFLPFSFAFPSATHNLIVFISSPFPYFSPIHPLPYFQAFSPITTSFHVCVSYRQPLSTHRPPHALTRAMPLPSTHSLPLSPPPPSHYTLTLPQSPSGPLPGRPSLHAVTGSSGCSIECGSDCKEEGVEGGEGRKEVAEC